MQADSQYNLAIALAFLLCYNIYVKYVGEQYDYIVRKDKERNIRRQFAYTKVGINQPNHRSRVDVQRL